MVKKGRGTFLTPSPRFVEDALVEEQCEKIDETATANTACGSISYGRKAQLSVLTPNAVDRSRNATDADTGGVLK